MARPLIGNLWVAKDERNHTFMRGYLFLTIKGRRRVYLAKVVPNKAKTQDGQPDYIVQDFTEDKPKIMRVKRRDNNGESTSGVQH
jgi:hypothetical protein